MGAIAIGVIALGTIIAVWAVVLSASMTLLDRHARRAADALGALEQANREREACLARIERQEPLSGPSTRDELATAERHVAFAREGFESASLKLAGAMSRRPFAARVLGLRPLGHPTPVAREPGDEAGRS